jgi:hypothetical protein
MDSPRDIRSLHVLAIGLTRTSSVAVAYDSTHRTDARSCVVSFRALGLSLRFADVLGIASVNETRG